MQARVRAGSISQEMELPTIRKQYVHDIMPIRLRDRARAYLFAQHNFLHISRRT